MADTDIQWADKVWNPVVGCDIVSPGCSHCYAMTMAKRLEAMGSADYAGLTKTVNGKAVWTGVVRTRPDKLTDPLKWKKPARVFVNSMSDLFHEDVPDEFIDHVFAVMALCPHLTFQILTKRPERMRDYVSDKPGPGPLGSHNTTDRIQQAMDVIQYGMALRWPIPGVWLGVSAEDQPRADERIPLLLQTPAAVRFVSYEPAIGPVNFTIQYPINQFGDTHNMNSLRGYGGWSGERWQHKLHWVIVGGESGPGARPFDLAWARQAVRQCREAGVACFVKQLGALPIDAGGKINRLEPASCDPMHGSITGAIQDDGWGADYFPRIPLKDKKGGNMEEWPADMRVRQFPDRGQAAVQEAGR